MPAETAPLFTRRFFTMCGFTFTVFLSAFQMLPTTPFRILDTGGSTFAAGLFLGFLTYSSALTGPITGALADRLGKRRILIANSLVIAGFAVAYALSTSYVVPLVLVLFHGFFWSGLLSASSAYMTDFIPESRRAEGIGYWGMSTMLAVAVAPGVGFWFYHLGWRWLCASVGILNLGMAAIAFTLEESPVAARMGREHFFHRNLIEWRIVVVAMSLFLCSFGYGGVTSFVALFAERNGVRPKGVFFTTFAIVTIITRVFSGRLADRIGPRKFFLPCLGLVCVGFALLSIAETRRGIILAALVFGTGFGNMYPAFVAHVVRFFDPSRRGAIFGGILAAFDTGIGTGSITLGFIIEHFGFRPAWIVATALSAMSVPFFLWSERRFLLSSPWPGSDGRLTPERREA
jgi:MFS family permease